MAPKKKEGQQKLSLGEFMADTSFGGSWADEVEDTLTAEGTQPLPATDRRPAAPSYGGSDRYSSYARQERDLGPQRLPDKPPYTAHLGNLSYDATQESVTDFFTGCEVTSVRIVEDRNEGRPKGFGYAEFATLDGLKKALELDGQSFQTRTIRIRVADPPRERQESTRDLSDWTRKGPLADLPSRSNDRRGPRDFNEPRPIRDGPADDGKFRDFNNWERKGPLSPLAPPPMERQGSRDEGRARTMDPNRGDSFRNRRASPAAWGPGEGRQEGSRPPRREFSDRPERAPSAADLDTQWRSNMRPDPPANLPGKSPSQSRSGSEAPSSPAVAPAAPAGRPRLNLQKRTISDAPAIMSPSLASSDAKASPFGAARPIDTAAREREIEEKHEQREKEKREAEEKAKEERRLAKEAATKEAAAKAEEEAVKQEAAKQEAAKPNGEAGDAGEEKNAEAAELGDATSQAQETPKEGGEAQKEDTAENGTATEQKVPLRPKEQRDTSSPKSRATESGNWRQASGGPRNAPTGPRDRRGGGPPRNSRYEDRREGSRRGEAAATPSTPVTDEDGWTTVPAAAKGRRNAGRPIAS